MHRLALSKESYFSIICFYGWCVFFCFCFFFYFGGVFKSITWVPLFWKCLPRDCCSVFLELWRNLKWWFAQRLPVHGHTLNSSALPSNNSGQETETGSWVGCVDREGWLTSRHPHIHYYSVSYAFNAAFVKKKKKVLVFFFGVGSWCQAFWWWIDGRLTDQVS